MLEAQGALTQSGHTVPRRLVNYVEVVNQPVIMRGFGMAPGEEYGIDYSLTGVDKWVPYSPNGYQKVLSTVRNPVPLATPGKYRITALTAVSGNARFDTIFGTTSHEWLLEYVEPIVVAGTPGLTGADGVDGEPGIPGAEGAEGQQGIPGIPGIPGEQGVQGVPGEQGEQGLPGVGEGAVDVYRPLATDEYVDSCVGYSLHAITAVAGNFAYYVPYVARSTFSAKNVAIATISAASVLRLGVYDSDGASAFYPGTLLETSGDLAGTVSLLFYTFPSPRTFVKGHLYWLALVFNNVGMSVDTYTAGYALPMVGLGFSGANGTYYFCLRVAVTGPSGGTLPLPFPNPSVLTAANRANVVAPRLLLQVA